MYRLTKSSAIIQMFINLCLSQVKEQLPENLIYFTSNPASFICDGELFSFIPNRSLVLDESLTEYGINLNYKDRLN